MHQNNLTLACIQMFMNGFDLILIYWYRYYCTLRGDANLIDFGLDSRSQECEKTKLLCQLFHKLFNWFEWDLLMWWTSYSFSVIHSIFKGENPTYVISLKNSFNIGLFTDIYRPISFNLVWWFWYQFGWLWPSFKVTVVWEIKSFNVYYLANLSFNLDEIHNQMVCWSPCWIYFAQVLLKGDNSANKDSWNLELPLTWSCVRTLVNWFVLNFVWC